jgi:hypothetical protein
MSEYGFKKAAKPVENTVANQLDVSGIKTPPIDVDPSLERSAITRGERIGFIDRGQGTVTRRSRKAQPSATIFVKGPVDTIQWFIRYTEDHGYPSYWRAIEDFRKMVESAVHN